MYGTCRLAPVTIEVDQSDICQSKMDALFAQLLMTASVPKVQRSERYPQTLRLQNCPDQRKVMNGLLIKERQALRKVDFLKYLLRFRSLSIPYASYKLPA